VNLKFPSIDLTSFWLGFILATILWIIILQIAKLMPKMKKSMEENRIRKQKLKDLDREHGIRSFILRKAQSTHLASNLFPLEKVLVEPQVILPVKFIPAGDEESDQYAFCKVLPETPEVPEILTDFPAVKVPLLTLIQGGQQWVAVSAKPGYGKTTALAHLTSQLCTLQTTKAQHDYFPIFFDYSDLIVSEVTPDTAVVNYLHTHVKGVKIQTLSELLFHADENQRLVFVMDGLDRYPISELGKAVEWLGELKKCFPRAFMVIACDPFVQGEISNLEFESFSLANWAKKDKVRFFTQWQSAWLGSKQKSTDAQKVDRMIHWLLQVNNSDSPLELTIKTWASLCGISKNNTPSNLAENYLQLVTGGWVSFDTAVELAKNASISPFPMISEEKSIEVLDTLSNGFDSTSFLEDTSSKTKGNAEQDSTKQFNLLVKSHFLSQTAEAQYRFTYPDLFVKLLVKQSISDSIPDFADVAVSPIKRLLFENKRLSQEDISTINTWLSNRDTPLYRDHLFALSWLKQTEKADPLREKIFKATARLLQDKNLPAGQRCRFTYALTQTQDPTIHALFNYFSSFPDPTIRQLSAIGLGLLNDSKLVPVLTKLSKDTELIVQQAACVSLNRIWDQPSQAALLDIIFTSDEDIRELACELISVHEPEGQQILQELTGTDNYLARKAAISGLVHIHEPWVFPLLEKLSIEDTQWVVRDAAKFALEHPLAQNIFTAIKSIPVLENPWTLSFSQNMKIDIPASGQPSELLYSILGKGNLADQRIALNYLLNQPDAKLIQVLLGAATNPQSDIREMAVNALYSLSKRGLDLKSS
jgi:HEAT repeat protein